MELSILGVVTGILLIAAAVLFLCRKFHIPSIVGFLLIGIVSGPFGIGLIHNPEIVEVFAEAGVILLLFAIGLEFSLEQLLSARKTVLVSGSLQIAITVASVAALTLLLGFSFNEAVFMGFLISLSSTAIVMKIFEEEGELDSLPARTSLGILIFQDLIIIPMMLVVPLLAGRAVTGPGEMVDMVLKGLLILAFIAVGIRWLIPRTLHHIARQRSRELFLFTVTAICLAIALLTAEAGLSLALGAFLAGLIIGESEFKFEALGNILPFRDVLAGLFFMSIGMLLDSRAVLANPLEIAAIIFAVVVLKGIGAGAATAAIGMPLRVVTAVGLSICQIGEFSFVLAKSGLDLGMITDDLYQVFLTAAIVTMAASPFLIRAAPGIADQLQHRLPRFRSLGTQVLAEEKKRRADHIIIVGFGLTGRSVARAAGVAGIPYTVIESNPDTVRDERGKATDILFGDATQEKVLLHAGIESARVLVVVISDRAAVGRIISTARTLNPEVYILARTRFMSEMHPLIDLGADEVIPEEYETSIELFTRVLLKYFIPHDEIVHLTDELRRGGYEMFRHPTLHTAFADLGVCIPDLELRTMRVRAGSGACGRTLKELDLRKRYGATVLAIRRGGGTAVNPGGDERLEDGDLCVMVASEEAIEAVNPLFSGQAGIVEEIS